MSTATLTVPSGTAPAVTRSTARPIPFGRVVAVELRKMFDTRSGLWLLASIGILALLASGAVIAFAPDEMIAYGTFASALGIPMSVILPVIAILSVTSEHSQRTGLTTYTLVPHRGRVIAAKAVGVLVMGIGAMLVALGVGALGNVVGSAITGADLTWGVTVAEIGRIVLAMVLTMFVGFMLGLLLRSSAAAIVGYFVYSFVVPTLFALLAGFQEWFRDLQPWVDFNLASTRLYDSAPTGEQWAQLGVTGVLWLVVPMAIGLVLTLRSEVK